MYTQKYIIYAFCGSFLCQASQHWLAWLYLALSNKDMKAHWFLTSQYSGQQTESSIWWMSLAEGLSTCWTS